MKATVLAVAVLVASTQAFTFIAPMQARSVGRSSALRMADVVDTLAELQGPVLYWGSFGVPLGHEENDIKGYDNFTKFSKALADTGVAKELKSGGPYTIFAPTDNAVDDFQGELTAAVVKNHIHEGKLTLDGITDDVTTMSGKLTYGRRFRKTFLDEAKVGIISEGASCGQTYPADVAADNGIIHAINAVLEC
eukprot:TRINITY_DN1607_c0_g1_i1.p3 TRINITY_DN1607_c0_g1~~TRINITY_DN1607_c0_g1_i1.p3  ORF type:complete len:193 (+),score=73.23 TRINITY_DN1607_c0_g1_i1:3225-3803(+)